MQMYLAAGFGPLFLYGLGASSELMGLLAALVWAWPFGDVPAAAAAASATAFSMAMVSLLGLLPRTPCALAEGAGGAAGGTGTAWSDKTDWTGPVLKAGKKKEKY